MKKNMIEYKYIGNKQLKYLENNFGYSAIGYYNAINNELYKQTTYTFKLKNLNELSKKIKIPKRKLELFINYCCKLYSENGVTLLSKNESSFWNENIIIEYASKINYYNKNKKGGRKKISIDESIKIRGIKNVNITENQYNKLIIKYGELFTNKAIELLDNWLDKNNKETIKYKNKNNYGHFRIDSWVITETQNLFKTFNINKYYIQQI